MNLIILTILSIEIVGRAQMIMFQIDSYLTSAYAIIRGRRL